MLLRPLEAGDWDALYAVASDPQIWAAHPSHDRWREPVFRTFFDDALAQGGALAVIERASGAIIGSSRFQGHDPRDGGVVEIGWTFLARKHWGTGANAEMKRLMLAHAFHFVSQVRFLVGEDNAISRRALANIGADPTGEVETRQMASGPSRHLIYAIRRNEWRAD